jgi:CHAT domain-containing protein/predicted negative regulator of RcsB-dependent stress response
MRTLPITLKSLRNYSQGHLSRMLTLLLVLNVSAPFVPGFTSALSLTLSLRLQDPAGSVEVRRLASGDVVQRRLDAGEKHSYELVLAAQQVVQIVVEQKGVDVQIEVRAPDSSLYVELDSPNGNHGPERVSIVSPAEGVYRVIVWSEPTVTPGDYELRVDGPRAASAADEQRVVAERLFWEAQRLRNEAPKFPREQAKEKYAAAIRKYQEALDGWRMLGDLRGQGYSFSGIGRVHKALGERDLALHQLSQALERLREAGDIPGQAVVLNETGATHRDLGNLRAAINSYEIALKFKADLNDRNGQAQLYNNLGLTYSNMGYQLRAAENLDKALFIWRELGLRVREMRTLLTSAKARVEMGDLNDAFAYYQTVKRFCDAEISKHSPLEAEARYLQPYALNGIGLVYDTWADTDAALSNYDQARKLFETANNSGPEADVLDNVGMVHAFLGESVQALESFEKALTLRKALGEPKGLGVTLSNIGYTQTLRGNNEEALIHLQQALSFSQSAHDRRFEAYTQIRIGMVYVALDQPQKALEAYEKALTIHYDPEFVDRRGQAIVLDKMGEALALLHDYEQAVKKYSDAIELWRAVGDAQGEALSLFGIARTERDRSNLSNARDRAEQAIEIVEKLRHKVTRRQLQMTYFASKQDLYALAIGIRMQLYRLSKDAAKESTRDLETALWLSERARARNLLDLLTEARVDPYKEMSSEDAVRNSRLERQISELSQAQVRHSSFGPQAQVDVGKKLAAYIKEQEELLASVRKANPSGTIWARPLAPKEIQQLLDDNTVLLQYSLDQDQSHLWTVTRDTIDHYYLPARSEIEKTATALRTALTDMEEQRQPQESARQFYDRLRQAPTLYERSAFELSRMILSPVWSQLGNKRLVVVADGALQYIPFEVLRLPKSAGSSDQAATQLTLINNEVVYEPSASALALLRDMRRPNASKRVAVIADPVFNSTDIRLKSASREQNINAAASGSRQTLVRSLRDIGDIGEGGLNLAPLPYSRREANAITAIARPESSLLVLGFKANRSAATSPTLRQFNTIHFATHSILNDKHPELSGIVLSMVNERGQPQDGFLTLRDIYNLDLPVHLVVLSACRTGVGPSVRGEGLIGLTRGFMHAGAKSVVVSLWAVEDRATSELMTHFYRYMLRQNKPPSEALRLAKLEMMGPSSQRPRPYFWAGFVLQGDWK